MLCRAGARQIAEAVLAGIRFTSARTPLRVAARALGAAFALATALLWPALTGAAAAATPSGSAAVVAPAWAYPVDPPPAAAPRPGPDATTPLGVPHSGVTFTAAQIADLYAVPDWHPDGHPPMPQVVAHGRRPAVYACGYCHLADGSGRPENAPLAGLPAAYIVAQMAAFRSGTRRSAWTGPQLPAELMRKVAAAVTDEEVAAAAAYFASLGIKRRVEVVETRRVPRTRVAGWLYVVSEGSGLEPLGERIIEVALDHERHELRDPATGYRAYVPRGSVAHGRTIALRGVDGPATACTACHGADLRGSDPVPPLAGRSPSYLLRQLLAFRSGARATDAGQPMQPIVQRLGLGEMIAVAAYVAAQPP